MNSNNIFENQGIINAVAATDPPDQHLFLCIHGCVSELGVDYLITVTKKRQSVVLE